MRVCDDCILHLLHEPCWAGKERDADCRRSVRRGGVCNLSADGNGRSQISLVPQRVFSHCQMCPTSSPRLERSRWRLLSLYDAIKAKQGKVKEIRLQLLKSLKVAYPQIIREQTRTSGVIIGALVIGFAISALELVCTGQVYLPTITFVMGVEGMRPNALSYLVLYNLMFVTPLLVVFGFVYWGTSSVQLGGVLQRHLVPVKVGAGVLLFALGSWLLFSVV